MLSIKKHTLYIAQIYFLVLIQDFVIEKKSFDKTPTIFFLHSLFLFIYSDKKIM